MPRSRYSIVSRLTLLSSKRTKGIANLSTVRFISHKTKVLQGDNYFSYLLVALEIPVGFDGLIEGEGPSDLRLERSIRQPIADVLLHGFPLRSAAQFAEGVAEHANGSTKDSQGEGSGLAGQQ